MDTLSYFSFQPVLHDCGNKGRSMCYSVCGMVNIKKPCCYSERVSHVAAADFLSRYPRDSLPYIRRHITINKMC